MSEFKTVFGIDLGTTYSCISYIDEAGKPVVVKNMEGDFTTPSIVYFENENNVVVGKTAKESSALFPDQTVSFIKRSMGKPGFSFDYNGNSLKPEEISSYILKKLVGDAERNLNTKINDVVITCPAYFGVAEKEATKNAGIIAGLNVLSIIDEPVAAAVMYGNSENKDKEDKVVLVYDLGGGTFDVTMIDIKEDSITVICTGGDSNLGGKNWDDSIQLYIAEQFQELTGVTVDDLFDDMEMVQELTLKSEIAKKELTQKEKAIIPLNFNGNKGRVELTRDKFNEITADLATKTMNLTRDMLTQAEAKGYNKFDELLLVGGSTRMLQIEEIIKKEFPDIKLQNFDPDESVSKGASIYAYMMLYENAKFEAIREIIAAETGVPVNTIPDGTVTGVIEGGNEEITGAAGNKVIGEGINPHKLGGIGGMPRKISTVTSKSFGVVAYNEYQLPELCNLITKNTNVPCEVSQTFDTQVDNQLAVKIVIMESEVTDEVTQLEMGTEIGDAVMELPCGLPAGSPIEVTFILNKEGILTMKAIERNENRECITTIDVKNGISEEELKAATERGMKKTVS